MTIQSIAMRTQKLVADNSPVILTGVGVAGVITTAVLTGKASIKAYQYIEREESVSGTAEDPKQRFKERAKLTWKLYIPPVLSAGFTVAAIVGSNRIGTRRYAVMAAAYSLSEKRLEEYAAKVVEKIGDNKEREIRDEIQHDRVIANPPTGSQIVITGSGDVLCYDKMSGRYFISDMESIKKAQNDTNYTVLSVDGYASLNDFYDKLDLDRIPIGEEVGWNSDKPLDIYFTTTMSDDQKPCIAIDFHTVPIRNYFRTH